MTSCNNIYPARCLTTGFECYLCAMQFSKIPGQTALKRQFISGVQNNLIPHAQLFSGPEGSAALPLAIAYAQYIACTNKLPDDSCGVCPSCIKMQKLIHPDLHFSLPANKENGTADLHTAPFIPQWREAFLKSPFLSLDDWVEAIGIGNKQPFISAHEAHEIIKALQFVSVESEYKFMIIWHPEKMRVDASNRILKTLEEPPNKTLIILVTQDYDSLLSTIRSRTQLIKVLPFTVDEAAKILIEQSGKDPAACKLAVEIAEGNMSQARWLLENGDEASQLLEQFRNWMLFCYSFKIDELIPFADRIAKESREWQKGFLTYGLYMIRQTLLMNHLPSLNRVTAAENEFINKFRRFFNPGNYSVIAEYMNDAALHIERNASSKIVIFDLSLLIAEVFRKEKTAKPETV
jgi:DNA polymerase III subunit delta'